MYLKKWLPWTNTRLLGIRESCWSVKNTSEWKNASTIFVSPDTALIKDRENVLLDRKLLIMASPKLINGYLQIKANDVKGKEREASTIKGAFKFGDKLETIPKVDMVVEGSVAVDRNGGRLGKGGGYGDVEISFLLNNKIIGFKTPIISTVHEIQLIENVPLESHDRKINMVVTPERVIRINWSWLLTISNKFKVHMGWDEIKDDMKIIFMESIYLMDYSR
jgi:5-formyltetrahydrofolate cyclo-ligase